MSKKHHYTLRIEGMTCDGCARHVTKALQSIDGVENAEVGSWKSGKATLLAGENVKESDLTASVEKAGYRAIVQERKPVNGDRKVPQAGGDGFDLMVIGGGSAAFAAAIKASELGAKVAIIEKGTIGGTCVNVGCVPSKTLIRAAEHCYKSSYHDFEGLAACPPPEDWQQIIRTKDDLVDQLRKDKYIIVAKAYPNISIIKGEAKLTGKRSLQIDGKTYNPGKILIATGSKPWAPPIPGLDAVNWLDSNDAVSIPELPETMTVIGAGAIGLELAQLFARFGVKVTLLEALPRIAAAEDPEISELLTQSLQKEKINVYAGVKIESVAQKNGSVNIQLQDNNGELVTVTSEKLIVATGRRPNTEGLGLEAAGVEIGKKGEILVNEHLQTSNPDIYAAGDCIGDPMYVYTAAYAGNLAAENALNNTGKIYDLFALPRVTFTDPQIASVGLSKAQAKEKGIAIKTSRLSLSDVPRFIVSFDTNGVIKLIAEEETGKLLGAHILAPEAGDVIGEVTLAIKHSLTVQDIIDTFHPYLTAAEGIKLAALTFEKDVHQLSCCAV
jgi:mercuric reductase